MTEPDPLSRPVPVPDEVSEAYWAGAREGRLMITRCPACGHYVHPPQSLCPRCHDQELVPEQMSGAGTVYSYSVNHLPGVPGFTPPYAVAIIELAEQQELLTVGNVLDCPVDELEVGMPVRVTFEKLNDEITLPQWKRHQA